MSAYIIRRILYAVPILICVNVFTFLIFFFVNTPEDVAHVALGQKYNNPGKVYRWMREHNYHLPAFLNVEDTILYISGTTEAKKDIAECLAGYDIEVCPLDRESVNKKVEELNEKRLEKPKSKRGRKPEYSDGFLHIVKEIKKDIAGNEIIIIDWPDITKEQAVIVSGLLEKGIPFVFVLRRETPVADEAVFSSVYFQQISKTDKEEDLEKLRKYIDVRQMKGLNIFTQTIFYKKSVRLFWFNFGKSDRENVDISYQVVSRMGASMMITIPAFILGIFINVFISMIVAYTRGTYLDRMMALVSIIIMSILSLFYYFSSQLIFGQWLKIFPVSGYQHGFNAIQFVMLPVLVTVFIGLGGGVRFYRTIFLEEVNREYVRTARAKGMSEMRVLFKHVLKNAMIPILTNVVLVIPRLFIGSLILESFFGIPGLGGFTLEGIQAQDFRIVGSMVYLGSFLYIIGLLLTDISYTLVDPRVRLE